MQGVAYYAETYRSHLAQCYLFLAILRVKSQRKASNDRSHIQRETIHNVTVTYIRICELTMSHKRPRPVSGVLLSAGCTRTLDSKQTRLCVDISRYTLNSEYVCVSRNRNKRLRLTDLGADDQHPVTTVVCQMRRLPSNSVSDTAVGCSSFAVPFR